MRSDRRRRRAARDWANPLGKPGDTGIPFHTVLLAGAADVEALRRELSA